ncbi:MULTISPECIES: AraC family transcriptional regulator [unclassified Clostridium]|uniref:helix-turn-helix domain-containing protein n=1 Tax=unclassified Clostridium TaxID=2614128 RepID=UPI000297E052|nr:MULTISPECIES: AraC family transcriptional regulator [unclassified Clostridium]EKQ56482.1 MAG: DNA-binding domain-containing protein, AraC-type [Clostridium sp. Maddingley MBC34-26]
MNKNILKETTNSGDSMFPLYFSNMEIGDKSSMLNCHWHDEIEFILVSSGRAIFQIENSSYEVSEGEIIIISAGELHSAYSLNSNNPCICKSLVFNSDMLSSKSSDAIQIKFINPLINNQLNLPHHLKCANDAEIAIRTFLFELASTLSTKECNYELTAKSYLYMIFSKIMLMVTYKNTNKSINSSTSSKIDNFKHILNYIHVNYNKPLTIRQLSSELNMSEGHFCRTFKSFTFKTPIDYLNYYRITKAQDLLLNSNNKVLEISMDVGFNNLSYFINIFKKNTGYKPSEFRNKFKNNCLT